MQRLNNKKFIHINLQRGVATAGRSARLIWLIFYASCPSWQPRRDRVSSRDQNRDSFAVWQMCESPHYGSINMKKHKLSNKSCILKKKKTAKWVRILNVKFSIPKCLWEVFTFKNNVFSSSCVPSFLNYRSFLSLPEKYSSCTLNYQSRCVCWYLSSS